MKHPKGLIVVICLCLGAAVLTPFVLQAKQTKQTKQIDQTNQTKPVLLKTHCRTVIRRTAVVIIAAQKAAAKGHQSLGLGMAILHQRYARKMYAQKDYLDAIHHSLRARSLAAAVIRRNKGKEIKEMFQDKTETNYAEQMPTDHELDVLVDSETLDDEAALKVEIDINIDEDAEN
jgi:hypothetical protein